MSHLRGQHRSWLGTGEPTGQAACGRRRGARAWGRSLSAVRWMWVPLLAFVTTRLGIALLAYVAVPLIPDSTPPPYHLRPPDNLLLDVFGSRWDTGFYLSIAEEGYRYRGVPLPSVAFFPLFPLTIRAVTSLTRDAMVAGLIVANLALLGATLLLYRLTEEEWGTAVANRSVWYLLIFPTTFFGSAIYSESLFLLLAIGALYAARKGYWESAAMLGMFAALTRFVGLIVAPVLFLEWWTRRRRRIPEQRPPLLAAFAPVAVVLGTGLYMLYLQHQFGDPLAFVHGSAAWGREPSGPIETVAKLLEQPVEGWGPALLAGRLPLDGWIDLLTVLLFLGMGTFLLSERRWSESAFVLLGASLPLASGLLMSQRRYMWVLFPAYILLARWGKRPWVDRIVTVLSLMGLGLFTAMFANGYWVG